MIGADRDEMRDLGNEEVICLLREIANDVLGGNCTYADDDVRLLGELAKLAIAGGLTANLHSTVMDSLNRKHGKGKYAAAQYPPSDMAVREG